MALDSELLEGPCRCPAHAGEGMNCGKRRSGFVLAAAQYKGGKVITVDLMGPDKVLSFVQISKDTTVRDVATSKYHLFGRTTKRNGISVVPFTTRVVDGDTVTVENA